jgi:hypothetical protein
LTTNASLLITLLEQPGVDVDEVRATFTRHDLARRFHEL